MEFTIESLCTGLLKVTSAFPLVHRCYIGFRALEYEKRRKGLKGRIGSGEDFRVRVGGLGVVSGIVLQSLGFRTQTAKACY